MAESPQYNATTWTVAELLEEVKEEAAVPSSSRITDPRILAFADQAIRSIMTQAILQNTALAGRWLDFVDTLVSDGLSAGAQYFVPSVAASGTISHVDWYASNEAQPRRLLPVPITEAFEIDSEDGNGDPSHYYFHDNRITLVPRPALSNAGARVRIWFPRAHPKLLVTEDNVANLATAHTGSNTLCPSAGIPANWPSAPFAVDAYSAKSPHSPFLTGLKIDDTPGGCLEYIAPVSGEQSIEDLGQILTAVGAGSVKLSLSGTCDCVQLPDSYRGPLTKRVASYVLRAIGHENEANSLWGISREDLDTVADQMQPRTKGSRNVVINRFSRVRSGRRFSRRWW